MKRKFKEIMLPYFIISVVFLFSYSFFFWLITIYWKFEGLDEHIFGIYCPIVISACITWFLLRKKLSLIVASENSREILLIISWILLIIPIVTSDSYLETKCGKLTKLRNVDEICSTPLTKYYSIENAIELKGKAHMDISKSLANRGHEIEVNCSFVCPLISSIDSSREGYNVLIEVIFRKSFSNRVFDNKVKQKQLIANFIDSSALKYLNYKFQTHFLERVSNSTDEENFFRIAKASDFSPGKSKIVTLMEKEGTYGTRTELSLP